MSVTKSLLSSWPLLIGLFLGLLISFGIRSLSSRTILCPEPGSSPISVLLSRSSPSAANPDQLVVNLATNSRYKAEANLPTNPGSGKVKVKAKIKSDDKGDSSVFKYEPWVRGIGSINESNKKDRRELLFVGVMTANAYINSRAKAVWESWAQEIPGRVVFFTGANSLVSDGDLGSIHDRFNQSKSIPLVSLPGVDDSYPPQKKSFMMIKYMFEHYGDSYEWFMRADDDVYIRSDKLSDLLRSIDSRKLYFIGQAGKGNQVEKGTLNLAQNENFCMGGPGIVMSRPTLAKLAPRVLDCLKDMYSTHEDVEVGRCVQRFVGISCTWAYEMQTLFNHNSSGDQAFTGKLKRREVHKAITLHPVKNPQHLYRLHAYFQGLKIQDGIYEAIVLYREFLSLSTQNFSSRVRVSEEFIRTPNENSSVWDSMSSGNLAVPWSEPLASTLGVSPGLNKFQARDQSTLIPWNLISKGLFSAGTANPKQTLRAGTREALEDVVRELMDVINGLSRHRGRVIDFKEILYGYERVSPLHGVDYILDLLMTYNKYRGKKMTIPVRRHVYIQRPFGPLRIRRLRLRSKIQKNEQEGQGAKDKDNFVLIVPLSGRLVTFQRFLKVYSNVCKEISSRKESNLNLNLVVVFFGSDTEKEKFLEEVNATRMKLDDRSIIIGSSSSNYTSLVCPIRVVQVDGEFSRAVALETGISQCSDPDLLFLIDVDLRFSYSVLRRVVQNTVKGVQVYFPVVFSQYNPALLNLSSGDFTNSSYVNSNFYKEPLELVSDDLGYWREFGYGIAGFYKSDFRTAGGFDTSIKGWGKEDVALFERFVHHTNLTVFRAPDPELIHGFHPSVCDKGLPRSQYDMCLGTKENTAGSVGNLMKWIWYRKSHSQKLKSVFS